MCGAMMLATLLNYMDRQVLPQIATELKDTYSIDDARYGTVGRNFAWAFAIGSICFGFAADRTGPRLLYPVVLIGWSAAGLASARRATPHSPRTSMADSAGEWCAPLAAPVPYVGLGFFEAGQRASAKLLTGGRDKLLTAKDRPLGNGLLQSNT